MLITFGDEGKVTVQVNVKLKVRLNISSFFINPETAEKVSLLASSRSNLHLCQIQMLESQEHKSVHVKTLSAGFQELTNSENTCAVFKLHSERWKCGCFP